MKNDNICNISDLVLHKATELIEKKKFTEAAKYIIMVIIEFDENADTVNYLYEHYKLINIEETNILIDELVKQMKRLCPNSNNEKRNKMIVFCNNASSLFSSYGYKLGKKNKLYLNECLSSTDLLNILNFSKKGARRS